MLRFLFELLLLLGITGGAGYAGWHTADASSPDSIKTLDAGIGIFIATLVTGFITFLSISSDDRTRWELGVIIAYIAGTLVWLIGAIWTGIRWWPEVYVPGVIAIVFAAAFLAAGIVFLIVFLKDYRRP